MAVADRDGEAAQRVAAAVGGTALTADLSEDGGVDAVVAAVGGQVDVLVNCAGGWSPTGRHFPDAAFAEWDAVLMPEPPQPDAAAPAAAGPAVAVARRRGRVDLVQRGARHGRLRRSPEYAVAKAGLIRLTTALADWSDRFGVRVACVAPGWIGLPRAVEEVAAMPAGARPPLIPPALIAAEVLRLVTDARSGGRVVVMDEGEPARTLTTTG